MTSSLLLLSVLGEELLVALSVLLGVGPAGLGLLLDDGLATEALLGDHALDLGGLVDSLVSAFDLTLDNVVADIVLLAVKGKGLDNVTTTLGAETVGTIDVSDTIELLLTLLDNTQEDSSQVRVDNATAYRLSLAVTVTLGVETSSVFLEKDACAVVDQDTLLHLETLLVVATSDSENVALVGLIVHQLAGDLATHTFVVEGTDEFFIINFNFLLSARGGVRNVESHL